VIKALNIATQGLLQAEKRATDVAKDILKATSESPSFQLDLEKSDENSTATSSPNSGGAPPVNTSFGNLIQQFADLRAEENAFKASATTFKKIDETLGTLLDDKG